VAVSGKYLVMETPDTFGGEQFVRFDTFSFSHVVGVVVGGPSAASYGPTSPAPAPAGAPPLPPNSSFGSLSLSSHGPAHGSAPLADGGQYGAAARQPTINQVMAANKARTGSSGSAGAVAGRVTISYVHPASKEPGLIVLQTTQAIQLHSMLR
jgi:hypothetical protein